MTKTTRNPVRSGSRFRLQQIAASIGTALFSVLLTNGLKDSENRKLSGAAGALKDQPDKLAALFDQAGLTPAQLPLLQARALADMADSFSFVFVVATILVACCLIPAAFLPRTGSPSRRTQPR